MRKIINLCGVMDYKTNKSHEDLPTTQRIVNNIRLNKNRSTKMDKLKQDKLYLKDILDTIKLELNQETDKEQRTKLKEEYFRIRIKYTDIQIKLWGFNSIIKSSQPKTLTDIIKDLDQRRNDANLSFYEEMRMHSGYTNIGGN
jgi:hypothetical protein